MLGEVDVSAKEVSMAEALVESLTAPFEPEKYRDEYREQVLALIDKKAGGEEFELPAVEREAPKVVDLMAALEASVQAAKEARKRHPAGAGRGGAGRCGEEGATAQERLIRGRQVRRPSCASASARSR